MKVKYSFLPYLTPKYLQSIIFARVFLRQDCKLFRFFISIVNLISIIVLYILSRGHCACAVITQPDFAQIFTIYCISQSISKERLHIKKPMYHRNIRSIALLPYACGNGTWHAMHLICT